MIFHSQYSLTIGQYEIMEITGDKNILCKLPFKLPKKWLDKAYTRLMVDYNKQANKDKIGELIEKDFEKIEIADRAVILECLEEMIKISVVINEVTDNLKKTYKRHYGKEPVTEADFEQPFKDKERLIIKANQYYKPENKQTKKNIDIKQLIINISLILNDTNIRNHGFYLLPDLIKKAYELNKPKK